jgi:alkaline phosphatase D
MTPLTRRESLAAIAALAAMAGTGASARSADASVFRHGVASGDPGHTSVVLWTRISSAAEATDVDWEVAADPRFRSVVAAGRTTARRSGDQTVKIVPDGLEPGATYFYRFRAGGEWSQVGRARTLAREGLEAVGIALMSCTNYSLGYFNAYDAIASDPAIDYLLHTGDYYYEYGNAFAQQSAYYVRPSEPANETITLDDYRLRHATHKSDPHSQRMHAAHTLIALWDDHEFCNDAWSGGGQNHDPATEGAWQVRRDAAVKAYYEWMPVRDPVDQASALDLWREYRFGGLATMVTLEARLSGRDRSIEYPEHKVAIGAPGGREAFLRDVLGAPDRRMLSPEMETVLGEALGRSVEAGEPWRLIGNGTLLARVATPDLKAAGIDAGTYPELGLLNAYTDLFWRSEQRLPESTDAWDGYPAARRRFYDIARAAGATDLIALSGDSHAFWSNALVDDDGAAMGLEIGTAGVTSPSMFDLAGVSAGLTAKLDDLYAADNPDVAWSNSAHRGYVRLRLTRDAATADYVAVETAAPGVYAPTTLRTDRIVRRAGVLTREAA